jgi:molybdenum cofactor guanylyltransferase
MQDSDLRKRTWQGEVCILAGGLSTRMGRDKSRLRLGRQTLLGQVRMVAGELGFSVRVIRRDLVERCGPLGGVYTALKTSRAESVLFLACDMPFVSGELLEETWNAAAHGERALFTDHDGTAGFPFVLPAASLEAVERQLARRQFSLQKLAGALKAKRFLPPARFRGALVNINTPVELQNAREQSAL